MIFSIGIDAKTVRGWVSVLEASGVVRLLRPFFSNTEKRLMKSPKLFFMDTGLACYLTAWLDGEALRRGAAAGHMFETFVVRGTQELPERRGRCAGRELLPR